MLRAHLSALGGMDWCVAGFLRVTGSDLPDRFLLRFCPELRTASRTPSGVPVHVQLLGSDPARMAVTASRLVAFGVAGIDLNFGCPVRRVNGHGGGAALLRNPGQIERIVAAVRGAVPEHLPVSGKIRLGWESPADVLALAGAVERGGASWVTIHGRTRAQAYEGTADWTPIGLAREKLRIPVVANGDIRTPEDLERCRQLTGCDRFLIGRGAIERPETFRVLAGVERDFWPWERRLAFAIDSVRERMAAGELHPGILGRLKGWLVYMGSVEPSARSLFDRIRRAEVLEDVVDTLARESRCDIVRSADRKA